MATPQLTPELSGLVAEYMGAQRKWFSHQAAPLAAAQRAAMDGFFTSEVLSTATVLVLRGVRVENPPFYPILEGIGFTNLPDFSGMAAITFSDVVVSHEPFTDGLLFHELVHVEQYRQLGIPSFAELYVRGFLRGGGYDGIPLEVNAHTLGGRYESNPAQQFAVTDEVRRWITEGGF